MVKLLSVEMLADLIQKHGFNNFLKDLITYTKEDFSRWESFDKMPRPASHVPGGVIELMPICDDVFYSYKYVNGHPKNPESGKQTVIATGQLSRVKDGYPLMISEMTTLTALRTAATSALATDLMSRKDSQVIALLGTGAQSEFQVLAHKMVRNITTVKFYDVDPKAMDKFEKNMAHSGLELIRCDSGESAVRDTDIIIVCTACKNHVDVVKKEWVKAGTHINGLGGDCPGKTELDIKLLPESKVIVEFFEQSFIEGEIQRFDHEAALKIVHAELWEVVTGKKPARENDQEITIFDSVGFAIEDFSVLRLTYELACKYNAGVEYNMVPPIKDPKNLISVLEKSFQKACISERLSA